MTDSPNANNGSTDQVRARHHKGNSAGASPSGGAGGGSSHSHSDPLDAFLQSTMSDLDSGKLMKSLRPMQTFLMPQHFSRPRNATEVTARLELNINYFFTNYIAMSLVILFFAIITRPLLIFMMLLLIVMWYFLLQKESIIIGTFILKGKQKLMAGVGTSIAALILTAGTVLFMVVGICASIVVVHALLHNTIDVDDDDDDGMGGSGGQAATLDDMEGGGSSASSGGSSSSSGAAAAAVPDSIKSS
jgi:hypothetical protein